MINEELQTLARQLNGISRVALRLTGKDHRATQVAIIAHQIDMLAEQLAKISKLENIKPNSEPE